MEPDITLKINKYEKKIIDYYREYGITRGQSPIIATILGYLLIYESLTQQKLNKLTNYSTGSISTNLNAMISMGMIEKKIIRGRKKPIISYFLSDTYRNLEKDGIIIRIKHTKEFIKFIQLKESELTNYLEGNFTEKLKENLEDILIYLQKFRSVLSKYKEIPLD